MATGNLTLAETMMLCNRAEQELLHEVRLPTLQELIVTGSAVIYRRVCPSRVTDITSADVIKEYIARDRMLRKLRICISGPVVGRYVAVPMLSTFGRGYTPLDGDKPQPARGAFCARGAWTEFCGGIKIDLFDDASQLARGIACGLDLLQPLLHVFGISDLVELPQYKSSILFFAETIELSCDRTSTRGDRFCAILDGKGLEVGISWKMAGAREDKPVIDDGTEPEAAETPRVLWGER